jgi:hypothetical protein
MSWDIRETKNNTLESKSVGVYMEDESDMLWRDWEVWLEIAENEKSRMQLFHNGSLRSSYDRRETDTLRVIPRPTPQEW